MQIIYRGDYSKIYSKGKPYIIMERYEYFREVIAVYAKQYYVIK